MRTLLFGASLLLLSAAACGGDDGDNNDNGDVTDVTDDISDDSDDAVIDAPPGANCLIPSSLGDVTPTQGTATTMSATEANLAYDGLIDGTEPIDVASVLLFAGYGVFSEVEEIAVGMFTLNAEEGSYETCGACVILSIDATEDGATAEYMPTSGMLDLTSVSGNLTGTLTDATFVHVDIGATAPYPTTPNADGCRTTVDTLTFDAAIDPEARGGRGAIRLRAKSRAAN